MSRPSDHPAIHVAPAAVRPGLVELGIGGGMAFPYCVNPEFAIELADQLRDAATAARTKRT